MTDSTPRIVILGSGFGGMYTYKALRRQFRHRTTAPHITIISKDNYFLFTPLLHEVATGSVNQRNIIQPVRQIMDSCQDEFLLAEVQTVDQNRQVVITSSGEVAYDYLVIALGSTTNLRHLPAESVFTLKTLSDAHQLKNHILTTFELAARADRESRRPWLTHVVIGGGPTGVELIAELAEFTKEAMLDNFPQINPDEVRLVLVHGGSSLVGQFHRNLQQKAESALRERHGVEILLNTKVTEVGDGQVKLSSGEVIPARTVIAASGVQGVPLSFVNAVETNSCQQIVVNQFLQLPHYPNIYVVGDLAAVSTPLGQVTPQTAQAAEAGAGIVAYNLLAQLHRRQNFKPFIFRSKGQLASLGNWMAMAQFGRVHLFGHFAWWVWRSVYASKIIGWPNKLRVILDWTIDIFYQRDISRTE